MSRTRRWVNPRYINIKLKHDNIKGDYASTTLIGDRWMKREAKWLARVLRGSDEHHGTICASATQGVLNKWDDVSSNYGKETANRKIRRWHKHVTVADLQEHYINVQLDVEELKQLELDHAGCMASTLLMENLEKTLRSNLNLTVYVKIWGSFQ